MRKKGKIVFPYGEMSSRQELNSFLNIIGRAYNEGKLSTEDFKTWLKWHREKRGLLQLSEFEKLQAQQQTTAIQQNIIGFLRDEPPETWHRWFRYAADILSGATPRFAEPSEGELRGVPEGNLEP